MKRSFVGCRSRIVPVLASFWLILGSAFHPALLQAQTPGISKDDRRYLEHIYQDTFHFILDLTHSETGLPYDSNRRREQTSVTNIGFYIASVAVGSQTGLISREEASQRLEKALNSLEDLPRWRGFPVSWVNIHTLSPEFGSSFSYADHIGNLIASLLVVKGLFPELKERIENYMKGFDLGSLYDPETGWLKGGYDTKKDDFTVDQPWGKWYYSLAGSDTRFLSFYGIAAGKFPAKHWAALNRLTEEKYGYEYLTPGWQGGGLFMQYVTGLFLNERDTELGRSARNFALAQMEHAKRLKYPVWGWSACEAPWGEYLGWGHMMDRVVTPHASVLAVNDFPGEVIRNLRELERLGTREKWEGQNYGFRDSIDLRDRKVSQVYLMLDQTMLFLSLSNFLYDGVVWKSVRSDPLVQAGFQDIYLKNRPQNKYLPKALQN